MTADTGSYASFEDPPEATGIALETTSGGERILSSGKPPDAELNPSQKLVYGTIRKFGCLSWIGLLVAIPNILMSSFSLVRVWTSESLPNVNGEPATRMEASIVAGIWLVGSVLFAWIWARSSLGEKSPFHSDQYLLGWRLKLSDEHWEATRVDGSVNQTEEIPPREIDRVSIESPGTVVAELGDRRHVLAFGLPTEGAEWLASTLTSLLKGRASE